MERRSFYLSCRARMLARTVFVLLAALLTAALVRAAQGNPPVALLALSLTVLLAAAAAAYFWIGAPFRRREQALRLLMEG